MRRPGSRGTIATDFSPPLAISSLRGRRAPTSTTTARLWSLHLDVRCADYFRPLAQLALHHLVQFLRRRADDIAALLEKLLLDVGNADGLRDLLLHAPHDPRRRLRRREHRIPGIDLVVRNLQRLGHRGNLR